MAANQSSKITHFSNVTTQALVASSVSCSSATATLVSNAATVTKRAVQVTSEALTTAAGPSQSFVLR